MLRTAIAFAVATAAALPAIANDSSAEPTTGGLIFVRNENVEMQSEDLRISAKEIDVRYRFFNKSDKPVTVLVAFPMPEIKVDEQDQVIAVPTEDPLNFLAFTTTVNGQPVDTKVEQRVLSAGLDRTELLRSLGLPLAPHLASTNEALDRLPQDKWEQLLRLGIVEIEEYDAGQGMKKHLAARWGLQTTFYWEQTFAAKAETVIEHRYKPSVGATVQTSLGLPDILKEAWYDEYKFKYCMDQQFLAAIERARASAKSQAGAPFAEERIEYILKTAANWSGPIKEFRLVVDKGEPDNLLSFCGEDIKKIGDTQFEVKKADFLPDGNLAILILKKLKEQ
jgi:hypothetical protein